MLKLCSECWTEIALTDETTGEMNCTCKKNRKTVTAWLDVEGAWEDEWASNFVSIDDTLMLSQPQNAEEAIDLAHAALQSQVDIIVIDSIAFLTPTTEQEKSAQEQTIGVQARMVGSAMRKFVSIMNGLGRSTGRRPTIILTNQIRQKVGVMYGSPDTVPGGLAAGFATSVEVKTSVDGKYEMDDATGKPIQALFKAKIEKNKMSPPKMEAEWKVQLLRNDNINKKVGDIVDENWAFSMGEKAGVVKVAPQKIEWGGQTFRGRSLLEAYWMKNPLEYRKLREELMPIILAV